MTDYTFVSSQGVLGFRSNRDAVNSSWGHKIPPSSLADFEKCAVRISLIVDEEASRPDELDDETGKYHYFSGRAGADRISYRRALFGSRELQMVVSGLEAGEPMIAVNPNYQRFVTHRFMNLHSPGYVLTDIAANALLRNGYAPLHCSGFRMADETVLVLAPPNTGKTLTTMTACLQLGADFIAEDLAITDGERLFAVPWTSTFRYYEDIDTSRRSKALNRATRLLPPLELLPLGKTQGVDTMLDPSRIVTGSKVTKIVILERGRETVEPLDAKEATRKAVNLNRYEFNYMKAPTLVAYEFFNPGLNLSSSVATEVRIIETLVRSGAEAWVVRSPDATRYASLVMGLLNRPA